MWPFAKRLLSREDLDAIRHAIAAAETRTAGEIRVSVRERRSSKERGHSVERLAHREFHHLGMEKTAGRTGVLIYVLLSERKIQVIADSGIHQHVSNEVWKGIVDNIIAHFRTGGYRNGLLEGVRAIGDVLAMYVPPTGGKANELPNDVIVR
jgi:uncharacterized membrane protein